MPIINNPTASITLDPRSPTGRIVSSSERPDLLFADVVVGCDIDLTRYASWEGYAWGALQVDLLGVDGDEREQLTTVQWVEIDGEGDPAIRSSQSYRPGLDEQRRFERTCRVSQAVLDEDPAKLLVTNYGLLWLRQGDEIEARFTFRGYIYAQGWRPYRIQDIETASTTVTI